MSDDDTVPRLPPPPAIAQPTIMPPTTVPAPQHEQWATEDVGPAAQRNARRSAARRSRRRRTAVGALLLVGVAGAVGAAALTLLDGESDATSGTAIVPDPEFVVETTDFRFVMPAEPVRESLSEMALDREVTAMSWTVDTDDHFVQVLAIDFGEPIDESMAQAGFDSMNGGMARRADGNITSDEIFSDFDVWGRRTEITVDAGRLYATSFASGNWMVSVAGVAEGTGRPVHFDDIVASVEFE